MTFINVFGEQRTIDGAQSLTLDGVTVALIEDAEPDDEYLAVHRDPTQLGALLGAMFIRGRSSNGTDPQVEWTTIGLHDTSCQVLMIGVARFVPNEIRPVIWHNCETGPGSEGAPLVLSDGSVVSMHALDRPLSQSYGYHIGTSEWINQIEEVFGPLPES